MNTNNNGINNSAKIDQAETYYSMGLFFEALDAYKQMLPVWHKLDNPSKKVVKKRLEELIRKLYHKIPEKEIRRISSDEMNMFKKVIPKNGGKDATQYFETAQAFMENEFFLEAIDEYSESLSHGYSPKVVIPEIITCLFEIYSPDEMETEVKKVITKIGNTQNRGAQIKYVFGEEILKRGHDALATTLIRSASTMAPENTIYQNKLNTLIVRSEIYKRYQGLLHDNHITMAQLKRAATQSEKTGKSVAFYLIEHDKVPKENILHCLSEYYGCPYDVFNADIRLPADIMGVLNELYLMDNCWVPLRNGAHGTDILIRTPHDTKKLTDAKERIKAEKVNVILGLKEDIEQYIEHFYTLIKKDKRRKPPKERDNLINLSIQKNKLLKEKTDTPFEPTEFISAQFSLPNNSRNSKEYIVKVTDHFKYGLGFLLDEDTIDLVEGLNPGDPIKDICFYTKWSMIHMDITIKDKVKIKNGEHRNKCFLGFEAHGLS